MTYKFISKKDFPELIDRWLEKSDVYAPSKVEDYYQFQPLSDAGQMDLGHAINTRYPPKSIFFPQSEAMFRVRNGKFESTEQLDGTKIIVGIHPCDARALQLLDTVFTNEEYTDPYWVNRRSKTTILAMGCNEPGETCFCSTVGSGPFDKRGCDGIMTELEDGYLIEILTEKGEALFSDSQDAKSEQVSSAEAIQETAVKEMAHPFEPKGIQEKLYSLFDEKDYWQEMSQACLSCGVCTFLCPTCFCFDIVDEKYRGERVRNWDTCMFKVYSQEASGHNPRPTKLERTRQRIMHKYAYWLEQINEIGCTGCGRCIRYCPVGLDIREMIRSAQAWEIT